MPKKKKFNVTLTWEVWTTVTVQAENEETADALAWEHKKARFRLPKHFESMATGIALTEEEENDD